MITQHADEAKVSAWDRRQVSPDRQSQCGGQAVGPGPASDQDAVAAGLSELRLQVAALETTLAALERRFVTVAVQDQFAASAAPAGEVDPIEVLWPRQRECAPRESGRHGWSLLAQVARGAGAALAAAQRAVRERHARPENGADPPEEENHAAAEPDCRAPYRDTSDAAQLRELRHRYRAY